MPRRILQVAVLFLVVAAAGAGAASAHTMIFKGVIVAIEPGRLQLKTGEELKGESPAWFPIDASTKILRGKTVVTRDQARIAVGEKAFVTVDHQPNVPLRTVEIRLPAR